MIFTILFQSRFRIFGQNSFISTSLFTISSKSRPSCSHFPTEIRSARSPSPSAAQVRRKSSNNSTSSDGWFLWTLNLLNRLNRGKRLQSQWFQLDFTLTYLRWRAVVKRRLSSCRLAPSYHLCLTAPQSTDQQTCLMTAGALLHCSTADSSHNLKIISSHNLKYQNMRLHSGAFWISFQSNFFTRTFFLFFLA